MRSLIVAIYELGVEEIMVVAHSHCGACHMSYDHFHHEMIARGVTDETLDTIRKCGINLDHWLEGFKDTPTMGGLFLAADLLLANEDLMENHVLYLLDKGPNAKGKIQMTRMNDKFMEKLLRDDPVTFEQYYGRGTKGQRQSAANILPILVKKGLIEDYHHKEAAK